MTTSRGETVNVTSERGAGNEPILELKNISVSYGNIAAVEDLSLRVYPDEIVTLIGSNGAGKSTTLRTISGLLRPRAGEVIYKGRSTSTTVRRSGPGRSRRGSRSRTSRGRRTSRRRPPSSARERPMA